MTPEYLSSEAFGAITINRGADFPRRRHADSRRDAAVRQHEYCHEPAVRLRPRLVDTLEVGSATDAIGGGQRLSAHAGSPWNLRAYPSSATVSRLRPLARRRLRTIRPFLVDILTRKPCVFLRRRVFGWKVRLPFMLVLSSLDSGARVSRDGTCNTSPGSQRCQRKGKSGGLVPNPTGLAATSILGFRS